MKKQLLILLFLSYLFVDLRASHTMGGEIQWECSGSKYIFTMRFYRDCSGIPWDFSANQTIQIYGNPLPKDATGNVVSSILLRPDSTEFINNNNGDTSPDCNTLRGNKLNCPNGNTPTANGLIQVFYFRSSAITLSGTPGNLGWDFRWQSVCCRPGDMDNVQFAGAGPLILRATMFPTKDRDDVNPCIDSSPDFSALPNSAVCRGQKFVYNPTAIDKDLDSLVYNWSFAVSPPIDAPVPIPYEAGFSSSNPTPDKTADIDNIPATLNALTGVTEFLVTSGSGVEKFLLAYRVDSYRENKKIASIYREFPLSVFNCPNFPNGNENKVPDVRFNGISSSEVIVDVVAGAGRVEIPVVVEDLDIASPPGPPLQTLTVVAEGLMFTKDKAEFGPGGSVSPCALVPPQKPGAPKDFEPCAFLEKRAPTQVNGEATLQGSSGQISTKFVWEPDCKHIALNTGKPGTNFGVFSFIFRVKDDHCPIPSINYPTITVRVKDPFPLDEPIVKGVSVGLDGFITYQWAPPLDSSKTFEDYLVEVAATTEGGTPNNFLTIEPALKKYRDREDFNNNLYFIPLGGNPLLPNVLTKQPNRDWYLRMTTKSGCTDTVPSDPSQVVRVIEPDIQAIGNPPVTPKRAEARITWNAPKPNNAATKDHFIYESETHYYIWENDSVGNGIAAVQNPNNWYLRGDTTARRYDIKSNVCGEMIGIRIEARDTIITYRHGTAPGEDLDSIETLAFSTFSIIDTFFMVNPGRIPKPKFDTVEVKANGDVYFRVNVSDAGTIGTYRIYANSTDNTPPLATFDLIDQDSILIPNQGADVGIKRYVLEGIDDCDPNRSDTSFTYNTFIPTGKIEDCSGVYDLEWEEPRGFPQGAIGYRIYVDTSGTNDFELFQTINDVSILTAPIPVLKGRTYNFQVVAFDADDAVIMSAIHTFSVDPDARTNDIVPPPELRCTYVEDDGSVIVSFIPPLDPTENFNGYVFEYDNGADFELAETDPDLVAYSDTSVILEGPFNAQAGMVTIRAVTLSGCSGFDRSAPSIIRTIDINATPRPAPEEKTGDIVWNATGIAGGSDYELFKDTFNLRYADNLFRPFITTESFVDDQNGQICLGTFNYYVTQMDVTGCQNRSNIGNATYEDISPPAPLHFDFITYDLITDQIIVAWGPPRPNDVDSLFVTIPDGFNSGQPQFRRLFGQRWNISPMRDTISIPDLDARDAAVEVGAITKDACGNVSSESDLTFHRSMDIEVLWDVCDSVMILSWNPYEGFNENFGIVYEVYRREEDSTEWVNVSGVITDTTHRNKITVDKGDVRYFYYVRARTLDTTGFESNSNIDSDLALFEDTPRFGYLRHVTVLPPPTVLDEHAPNSGEIEIEFHKDPLINVGGYNIFKGTDRELLNPIAYIDFEDVKDDANFNFTDPDVNVSGVSYFYRVVTHNACDVPVHTSNFGRSMVLSVKPDHEALTNRLVWNNYEEWSGPVEFYNIYRGVERRPTSLIRASVVPSRSDSSVYVDDVFDDIFAIGKFCYVVEAVQGPITNEATNGVPTGLQPSTSRSNVVCVTQEPLFYVPNAFAPDGVNKVFQPKGQFFDYSRYEMVIYNRWGEEIFRTNDINVGWNGVYNGEIAPLGAYVYMIRFMDAEGQEHRRKGTVTLVR